MSILKKLLLTIFLFIGCSVSWAQGDGRIQGAVVDSLSAEALFGANLWLDGTSLGAASDIDGNYVITGVPAGNYALRVRYIGYVEKEIQVEVKAGQTLNIDISLLSTVVEGQEVVVTGQAQGQREAINQQLTSNTIKNVVSSEKIRQLPDASAAAALSRLPGLSLMNGDQIVIRGIQAKQNLVLVNGVQLPSTDINTRATGLGFISSNMLSGIEVVKVLTPDMDANAIGGVVNLRLREAPVDFHLDVLTQGSFNQQDRTWENYKAWASASDRFFDNKLGVFLQGNADRFLGGNDDIAAAYSNYGAGAYGQSTYRMDNFTLSDQQHITSTAGGSLILDYQLPNGSILLQNTISNAIYDNATHNNQLDFPNNRVVYNLNRDKNHKILLINALQTEYTFSDIKADFSLSHSYSNKRTDIRFGDAGDATNFTDPSGVAQFGYNANGDPINFNQGTPPPRNIILFEEALGVTINPETADSAKIDGWAVLRDEEFDSHIYNIKLDFTVPVSFSSDFSSIFKVGGKFTRTTRVNDRTQWYKRVGSADFYDGAKLFRGIPGDTLSDSNPIYFRDLQNGDYDRGQYFYDGDKEFLYAYNIDRTSDFYSQVRSGWAQPFHRAGSAQNDFNGAEIHTAGYLMGTFSFGPNLSVIAGGRYEHYNMDYKATMFYVTHPVDGNGNLIDTLNTVDRNDDNFFPNVQVRYKFTEWFDLRAAYSKTVSRPDYNAILPSTFFSEGISLTSGNPKLKPAIATNYDLYLSFYNNEIGLFTVGGFYKEIENIFFQGNVYYGNLALYDVSFPDSAFWVSQGIRPPTRSAQVTTFLNNPNPAYIEGLEFDWQTNFWYLPEPFNSLVFNINYTKVWSEMDYRQVRNQPMRDPVSGAIVGYATTDTIRTARLLNQGGDIVNIALGVDYKGFSARISWNMQGNVITSVGARPEDDAFTGNIYKWDFTIKQELPLEGLSVQLNGVNIFHNVTRTYQKFRRVSGGEIFNNLTRVTYTPRIFELNLRYTL